MAISLREVEKFVSDSLPRRLKRDLSGLKMIKEADLECCAYHHLRRFLRKDANWDVFVRKHSLHTGHYIDLLLFRKGRPRVAIELKWNRSQLSPKDRRSLRRALRLLRVNKAYFVTTLVAKSYREIQKTTVEKNRLFEIVIPLSLRGAELTTWKQTRRTFMSRMLRGKAPKKSAA